MKLALIVMAVLAFAEQSFAQTLPPIGEVQRVALDYARIKPEDLSDLRKRARLAALLPRLQTSVKRNVQDKIDIGINENVSVTSSGVNVGPETSQVVQNTNDETGFEVKAIWYLNELIFNRDMLDVAEEARYQMRERRALIAEVNRIYFDLERLMQNRGEALDGTSVIRRDEMVADLDALTGGWFSRAVSR